MTTKVDKNWQKETAMQYSVFFSSSRVCVVIAQERPLKLNNKKVYKIVRN